MKEVLQSTNPLGLAASRFTNRIKFHTIQGLHFARTHGQRLQRFARDNHGFKNHND